jgi:hypothetical protein
MMDADSDHRSKNNDRRSKVVIAGRKQLSQVENNDRRSKNSDRRLKVVIAGGK